MRYITRSHPAALGQWAVCEDGKILSVHGPAAPAALTASGQSVSTSFDRNRAAAVRALCVVDGWSTIVAAIDADEDLVSWKSDPAIAFVGVETSDRRMIDSLHFRDFPLPVMANRETTPWGHEGAVLVGRMDAGSVEGENVVASGVIDVGRPEGADIVRLMNTNMLTGVSVDGGPAGIETEIREMDDDGWPIDWLDHFIDYECMGFTLTPFPAFAGAAITLDGAATAESDDAEGDADVPEEDTAAGTATVSFTVVGDTGLPVAPADTTWDAEAAAANVTLLAQGGDPEAAVDPAVMAQAFLWRSDDLEDTDPAAYFLPFADVLEEALTIVPGGVYEAGSRIDSGDYDPALTDEDVDAVKAVLDTLYAAVAESEGDDTIKPPWAGSEDEEEDAEETDAEDGVQASAFNANVIVITASGDIPVEPPLEWFDYPGFEGLTRWTVEDSGRVFGHLAPWGQCHVGINDDCVLAPKSKTDYGYFKLGRIKCAEGCQIDIGTVTFDTGHADKRLTARAAASHYDNTGTAAADVVVGEDTFGIWVAGALRPMDAEKIRAVRAAKLSGDWRGMNGNLELVAALAVNVPGFPTYEEYIGASGAVETMIASLMPAGHPTAGPNDFAVLRAELDHMHRVMGPVYDMQAERLASRVHGS